jgi:hypothetical protein
VPALVAVLAERALGGDIGAARLLLERTVAPLKASEEAAPLTMPDGTTQDMQTKAGTVSWTDATIHSPENLGDTPFQVIQVELK